MEKIWFIDHHPPLAFYNLSVTLCVMILSPSHRLPLFNRITESQNHRMFRVGRDLCGSSSPTPLPEQGHLQQAAQDLVQVGLEYLQRRRVHNFPGQPVPVLHHPQSEDFFPHVQTFNPFLRI